MTHGTEREYLGYKTHGTKREYLGYETHGTVCEDHVQLGTIVAKTQGPVTARFHQSLHTQYAAEASEGATGVDFKLPRGADWRLPP
jgi:hypothetical protein